MYDNKYFYDDPDDYEFEEYVKEESQRIANKFMQSITNDEGYFHDFNEHPNSEFPKSIYEHVEDMTFDKTLREIELLPEAKTDYGD